MPGAVSKGDVAVQIIDQRPGDQGGVKKCFVGQETWATLTGPGHASILAVEDGEPISSLKKLVSESLASTGYQPVEPMVGVPTLTVALTSFWCKGYKEYTMTLNANLSLSGGPGGAWSEVLAAVGNTTTFSRANVEGGFQRMLNQAVTLLVQKFTGAAFQAAVGAPAAPPPAAPAPTAPTALAAPAPAAPATAPTAPAPAAPVAPAAAECKLNSDCPIGQHCSANTCTYECREDRDCATKQVCNTQNGTCEKEEKKELK